MLLLNEVCISCMVLTAGAMAAQPSTLDEALRAQDEEALRIILQHGPRTSGTDHHGRHPLHVAAAADWAAGSKLLLASGADPNARDRQDQTPLHVAAMSGAAGTARVLIGHGAALQARDWAGQTPLHVAVTSNQLAVAQLLLECGADANARDPRQRTPLHLAADHDALKIAALLIARGADVDAQDLEENTPLHRAVTKRHSRVARLLLRKGADREKSNMLGHKIRVRRTRKSGASARAASTSQGSKESPSGKDAGEAGRSEPNEDQGVTRQADGEPVQQAARWLNERLGGLLRYEGSKAPVDTEPLIEALPDLIRSGQEQAAIKRLSEGVDVHTLYVVDDGRQVTLLHLAAQHGLTKLVGALISAGADIASQDSSDGRTPLHLAAQRGHIPTVALLLERGGEVDVMDDSGWTPLHLAGSPAVAAELLRSGADLNAISIEGWTALHSAAADDREQVFEFLIDRGLEITAPDLAGLTPLDLLAEDHQPSAEPVTPPVADAAAADSDAAPDETDLPAEFAGKVATANAATAEPTWDPEDFKPATNVRGGGTATGAPGNTLPGAGTAVLGAAALSFSMVPLLLVLLLIVSFWKLYSKAGEPGWAAVVPIYQTVVLLRLAGKPWWWLVLLMIPGVNVLLMFVIFVDLARNFDRSIAFALGLIFLGFIFVPVLAFGQAQYNPKY